MATLTSTAISRVATQNYKNLTTKVISFNSGATEISASATTINMLKVPNGATIVDGYGHVSSGAATCPFIVGLEDTLSAFVTGGTTGTIARFAVITNLPYKVSITDTAATQYATVKMTVTPGTATASVKGTVCVSYTMDNP